MSHGPGNERTSADKVGKINRGKQALSRGEISQSHSLTPSVSNKEGLSVSPRQLEKRITMPSFSQ